MVRFLTAKTVSIYVFEEFLATISTILTIATISVFETWGLVSRRRIWQKYYIFEVHLVHMMLLRQI